ncbi:MAG: hypothetical protein IT445_06885 [Phycisphaeraceae bacterium]|nr:hypothetical protein [Phycisphaeraceae bacterium]
METAAITIKSHPGTMTDAELSELASLARAVSRKSLHVADLLHQWIERERDRRSSEAAAPPEPRLLQVNIARWTDAELGDANIAAHVAHCASEDCTPRVRYLVQQLSFIVICWAATRLKNRIED